VGWYYGCLCGRSTRSATTSYRQCVQEFPLMWPSVTAGICVFCRKSVEYAKWGSGIFYQTCASCFQQEVSCLMDSNAGPVAWPTEHDLSPLGFFFIMGTFKLLMYNIHLQLKMKRDFTKAFCCLSFTIARDPLKVQQPLIRLAHAEMNEVANVLSIC